ncbi:MAG: hypothetical protein AAF266_13960, partial [Planctomycetota bacterium]
QVEEITPLHQVRLTIDNKLIDPHEIETVGDVASVRVSDRGDVSIVELERLDGVAQIVLKTRQSLITSKPRATTASLN